MKYRTIVVDPPWSYQNKWQQAGKGNARTHDGLAGIFGHRGPNGLTRPSIRGAAANYPCLDVDAIGDIPVGEWADDNAHMYLWTTNSFLRDAFMLMERWGFNYKTMITWAKTQIGMGMYFRNTTEHALFGVRGRLKCLRRDVPTHFVAARRAHSAKPEAFYDMVESMSPGPWLDVFARRLRMGWDCYGNEIYNVPGLPQVGIDPDKRCPPCPTPEACYCDEAVRLSGAYSAGAGAAR